MVGILELLLEAANANTAATVANTAAIQANTAAVEANTAAQAALLAAINKLNGTPQPVALDATLTVK